MNENEMCEQAQFLKYKIVESAKKTKRLMVGMVIMNVMWIAIILAVYFSEGMPEGGIKELVILLFLGIVSISIFFMVTTKPEENRRNYYIRELFLDLRNVDSKTAISYAEAQLELIQAQIEMQSTFIDERQVSLQEYYHSIILSALADCEDIKKEWKKIVDAMYLYGRYR